MTHEIVPTGEATAILPTPGSATKPITVIGTEGIRSTFRRTLPAAGGKFTIGTRSVTDLVLNPDAHCGYGAPVGCVMTSPTHIYPGPVGVDIKCSMSLLQLDLPADQIIDRPTRRALINAVCERTPTGAGRGQRHVSKSRYVGEGLGRQLLDRRRIKGRLSAVGDSIRLDSPL